MRAFIFHVNYNLCSEQPEKINNNSINKILISIYGLD